MKKNDWILIAITGIYSFLFYGEYLGINLSIFTILIIFCLMHKDKNLIKNKNWLITAGCCSLTAFTVGYFGNSLSITANFISLLVLTGISMNKKSSVFFSLIYGIYSILSSPVFLVKELTGKKSESVNINKMKRKLLIVIVPVFITIIFFFMYKNSNPIFNAFTDKINFDWISWGWIFFTLIGLTYLFGFLNTRRINSLAKMDEVDSLDINSTENKDLKLFGKTILVIDEYFSGKLLFILLNSLIAIVNLLDFNFLFINRTLPENLTFAQFLHQGVGMLVVSIAISIVIILFYFRGQLNFYNKNKFLKMLAYLWLLQNMALLFSVCLKNNMYIEEYGLTYKRIGIYIYSLLTFIGLITTILKVYKVKINMYLIRMNGWAFYSVLVISCMFNWDNMIIDYNQKSKSNYDIYYLLSLSDSTIPSLLKLENKIKNKEEKIIYKKRLNEKIRSFTKLQKNATWKSWNYQESKLVHILKKINS